MDWLPEYIRAWSRHNIHFGIYCDPSKLAFHAKTFHTACTSLEGFSPDARLPADITLSLSVADECLIYRFPHSYPIAQKRGYLNEHFLNPDSLLQVLGRFSERVIILLSIPRIYPTEDFSCIKFLDRLDYFLADLPNRHRYAIQLHNVNYILPGYFECLHRHNIAHVMDDSTLERIEFTTDFGLIRADSVSKTETRLGVVEAVRCAINERKTLCVYLDECTEGFAPLYHLMEMLNQDLKRLSPIKRKCAA